MAEDLDWDKLQQMANTLGTNIIGDPIYPTPPPLTTPQDPATRLAEALNIPRATAKMHLFRFIYGADAAKYDIHEVVDRMIEQYRSNKEQE